jgi:hypothetical protein
MAAPQLMRAIVLNKTHRRPFSRNRLRRSDIEKVIVDRHGVPDTDDADIYLIAVATCCGRITRESGKRPTHEVFAIWCEKWAPRFGDLEQADILDQALDNPSLRLRTDDDWGRLLRLSDAERTRLGITTIGSYDVDRKKRIQRQRVKEGERRRQRAAERRRAKGAIPRDQYLAGSLSRTEPWKKFGISRSTYDRRIKAGIAFDESPYPHPSSYRRGDGLSSRSDSHPTTNGMCLTNPPANAVGTHLKSIWYQGVDGVAIVGDDKQRFKTRFSTSMRLSKEARQYALDACFEPAQVDYMFETFGLWNRAKGSYSLDWDEVWFRWVDREVDIANEAACKARARDYAMRQAA